MESRGGKVAEENRHRLSIRLLSEQMIFVRSEDYCNQGGTGRIESNSNNFRERSKLG